MDLGERGGYGRHYDDRQSRLSGAGWGLESPVELPPEGGEERVPGEPEKWHTHVPLPHFDTVARLEPHGLLSVDRQNQILGRLHLVDRDSLRGPEHQGAYRERVWANRSDEDAVEHQVRRSGRPLTLSRRWTPSGSRR